MKAKFLYIILCVLAFAGLAGVSSCEKMDDNGDLAAQFGVNTIPYLVIFKDGKKINEFVGLRQANVLVDALAAAK